MAAGGERGATEARLVHDDLTGFLSTTVERVV